MENETNFDSEQKKEEGEVEEAVSVREEEEKGPEKWLRDPLQAPLNPDEGPSIRPQSPMPRRARSPVRVGGEQDIANIVDKDTPSKMI